MNETRNIHNKNNKFIVASIVIVVALALIACLIVTMDDAFATKKKKNNGNVAEESISQSQPSVQNALWASGGTTFLSCNDVSLQDQKIRGNNALAQQDNDDDKDEKDDSNFAKQRISQSQSSEQNSQVVSGGDTIGSGNNINV